MVIVALSAVVGIAAQASGAMTAPSQKSEACPQPPPLRPATASHALVSLVRALARSAAVGLVRSGDDVLRKRAIQAGSTQRPAQRDDGSV
jgi:hypothetical protein